MYTDGDIAYFKLLMEEMADTARKLLLPTQVLNLTNKMSKGIAISKVRAQCCIDKWVEQGYFAKEDNKIYFGPKMLLEFKDQLLTNDPDTTVCSLCKDISIWVIRLMD